MDYGTGAIFGCPAHDQRDLDFANKYGLGNTPVVCPPEQDPATFVITDTAYDGDGRMINSRFLDGMTIEQAKEEVAAPARARRSRGNRPVATRQVNFRLRDWGISRQRYWGCPIPVIHCERCGIVPVPESDLPVSCPRTSTSTGPAIRSTAIPPGSTSPARIAVGRRGAKPTPWTPSSTRPGISRASPIRWIETPHRPRGRGPLAAGRPVYRRHRACDPASALQPLLHPRDEGHRPHRLDEPFAGLFTQGMVVHETYQTRQRRLGHAGRCADRRRRRPSAAPRSPRPANRSRSARSRRCRSRSATPSTPTTSSAAYGADTARWFMLSDSPPERDVIWTEEGVQGAWRFVQRLWRLVQEAADVAAAADRAAARQFQRAGAGAAQSRPPRAGACLGGHRAAALQRLRRPHLRVRQRVSGLAGHACETEPMADYRWARARGRRHPGPAVPPDDAAPGGGMLGRRSATRPLLPPSRGRELEPDLLVEDTITLPVQINGKKRGDVTVARNAPSAEIETAVLALDAVKRALDGKPPKKVIVVPQRIVNVVA